MSRKHSIPIRSRVLARLEPFKWPNTYRSSAMAHAAAIERADKAREAEQEAQRATEEAAKRPPTDTR